MPKKKTSPVLHATLQLPVPAALAKGDSVFSTFSTTGALASLNLIENTGANSLLSRRVFILAAGAKIELECTTEMALEILAASPDPIPTSTGVQVLLGGTAKINSQVETGVFRFIAGKTYLLEAVDGPVVFLGVTAGHDGVKRGGERARLK